MVWLLLFGLPSHDIFGVGMSKISLVSHEGF